MVKLTVIDFAKRSVAACKEFEQQMKQVKNTTKTKEKMKKFSIDLKASGKGERKKAVKYLRDHGASVCPRKDNPKEKGKRNYLLNSHPEFVGNKLTYDFHYYTGSASTNWDSLTLPRDWNKLVEIVEGEKKEEFKAGDWVTVTDWSKLTADSFKRYSNTYKLRSDFDGSFAMCWDHNGSTTNGFSKFSKMGGKLRKATTEEIKAHLIQEAEKRGLTKANAKINCLCGDTSIWNKDVFIIEYSKDTDTLKFHHLTIYKQGQWAEIIDAVPEIAGYKLEKHGDMWGFGCTRFNASLVENFQDITADQIEEIRNYINK